VGSVSRGQGERNEEFLFDESVSALEKIAAAGWLPINSIDTAFIHE
jgi:hypothetical protein